MKTLIYILLFCTAAISAQNNASIITTEVEYNYLTKGYEDDIDNGRELKPGYELKYVFGLKNEDWTFLYEAFNISESKETKAILITITKLKNNKVKRLCLPFNNKELMDRFMKEYEKLGISMGIMFDHTVFELLQKSLNSNLNRKD